MKRVKAKRKKKRKQTSKQKIHKVTETVKVNLQNQVDLCANRKEHTIETVEVDS